MPLQKIFKNITQGIAACSMILLVPVASAADKQIITVTSCSNTPPDALSIRRMQDEFIDAMVLWEFIYCPRSHVTDNLATIPGVQINRESDGPERIISWRGLPGSMANLRLNGLPLANATFGGGIDTAVLQSELFNNVLFFKTPSAAHPAGDLSGSINMGSSPALMRRDGGEIKVGLEYNNLDGALSPSAALCFSKHFSPDFAIYGALADKKEDVRRDTIVSTQTASLSPSFVSLQPSSGNSTTDIGTQYASVHLQQTQQSKGEIWNAIAGVDYRVSRNLRLSVDLFGMRRFWDEAGTHTQIATTNLLDSMLQADPDSISLTPTSNLWLSRYSDQNAQSLSQIHHIATSVNWQNNDWHLETKIGLSKARNTYHRSGHISNGDVPQLATRRADNNISSVQQDVERRLDYFDWFAVKAGWRYENNRYKTSSFADSIVGTINAYAGNDYKILSEYLMGEMDTKILSIALRGNVGIRHEHTDQSLRGSEASSNKLYQKNYGYSLPSLNLAADVIKNLTVRYAAYKSYTRALREYESPLTTIVKSDTPESSIYSVHVGNPDLQAATAMAQDIGIEWYNRRNSVVALNLYRKAIRNFSYIVDSSNMTDIACPANGLFSGVDYGLGTLHFDGIHQQCTASPFNAPVGSAVIVNATGANSIAQSVNLRGWELKVRQNLSFLSAPWHNFGGEISVSGTTTDGRYPDKLARPLVIPGVSRRSYKFIGFYDAGKLSVHAVYQYRQAYQQPETLPFAERPIQIVKPYGQLDLHAGYQIKQRLQLLFDVYNLGNFHNETNSVSPSDWRQSSYTGGSFSLSVRAQFD